MSRQRHAPEIEHTRGVMRVLPNCFVRMRKAIVSWRAIRADVRSYRRFPEVDELGEGVREQLIAEVWAQYGDEDLMAEWCEETQRNRRRRMTAIALTRVVVA